MSAKTLVTDLAAGAGITINGDQPFDITVHDDRFYQRVVSQGSLGLGESYMDGWWDAEALDETFARILAADLGRRVRGNWRIMLGLGWAYVANLQSRRRAFTVGEEHYDIGNELYRRMLDKRLTYTCAYWQDAETLDAAQEAKLDLVCRKLDLQPGQRVLDIGCGWGSFMKFAAEKYGVRCVGLTVSKEQVALGRELCQGLPVEFVLQDYREYQSAEPFDHVVSLGMFEHVGTKNYDIFMKQARALVKEDGLFLLHTIGSLYSHTAGDPWMHKYIFPNGVLPALAQISRAAEGRFVIEDVHNFGQYYDPTLMAWHANFERAWPELKGKGRYDERFYRMWRYYLLSCAGSFRARKNQLWQIVLSPHGVRGGYTAVR